MDATDQRSNELIAKKIALFWLFKALIIKEHTAHVRSR